MTAVLGVLIYEAVAGDKSPPEVRLTVQSIATIQDGFLVKVRAENIGGEPAARVHHGGSVGAIQGRRIE